MPVDRWNVVFFFGNVKKREKNTSEFWRLRKKCYLCTVKRKQLVLIWRFRLAARTHASHAWNTSSILVGATKGLNNLFSPFFYLWRTCRHYLQNVEGHTAKEYKHLSDG